MRRCPLPAALDARSLGVEDREAAGAVAVGGRRACVMHDVVAGHAVDGVRSRVAGLLGDLLRLDDLVDLGPARVLRDVEDVDARDERKPGTIRMAQRSGPWQAELQRFQPKWCNSSPTLGIGVSWMIRPSSASTTAMKSGSFVPMPSRVHAR